ncbi:MAG TPA: CPBP family intramembrane glutamic endopeptidase [Puia sp.]|nr:CPBP family intramembrane glutamic endopeptidase [Puia sp.]
MSSNLKIPSPRVQLALLTILAGSAIIVGTVVASSILGAHGGDMSADPGRLKLAQAVSSLILFGAPALIYAWTTFRQHRLAELGFRPGVKSAFYWLAILMMACAFPMEGWLGMINKSLSLPHWMIQMEHDQDKQVALILTGKRPIDLITNLVVIAIIPGFVEELCFRGALQRVLIQLCKSPWAGIILTGVWFSFSHLEFVGFLPRTFLGILLGAIYWYSGSIWTVIIAHIVFNGFQVVVATGSPEMVTENPSIPIYWALLSLLLVVGLLAYMRNRSTVTYEKIYHADRTGTHDDFLSDRR